MVKIRLRRVGAKKQASFRVVVADSRSPRDGRFIEQIGFYNPRTEPETLRIDEERALYWLNVGAQPSDSAARLLTTCGTMARFERLKQGEPLEDLLAEAEEEALAAEAEEEEIEEEAPEADAVESPEVEAAEAEVEEPAEADVEAVPEPIKEGDAEEPAVDEPEAEESESEPESEPETSEAEEEEEEEEA